MSAAGSASSNLRTYGKRSGMKRKQDERTGRLGPKCCNQCNPSKASETSTRGYFNLWFPSSSRLRIDASCETSSRSFPYFDEIAPKSPSGSPSKLAKRMLSRSRTESSIESSVSSQPNTVDRTPSLPVFPSTPSRDLGDIASTSRSAGPLLPRLTQSSTKSITRTYAGKFRSFLVSLPKSSIPNDVLSTTTTQRMTLTQISRHLPLNRTNLTLTTPDMSPSRNGKGKGRAAAARLLPIPSGMMNPLKSISELRNRGESRRFLDEVGYLFEGMNKNGGIGLRRASALEITTKMCDADFARKAKAADFFTRTWDIFLTQVQGKDRIKRSACLFLSLVAREPTSLSELAQRLPASPISSHIPFKERTYDIAFHDLSLMTIISVYLQQTSPDVDPLFLASESSAVPSGRPCLSSCSDSLFSILSAKWHDTVVMVPYDNSQEDAECKERNTAELDRARDNWLADDLIAFLTLQRCLSTVLRVLVSLTHEEEPWGRKNRTIIIHRTGQEVLRNRNQIKVEEEDVEVKVEETEDALSSDQDGVAQADSHALDTLCLALGLLTNLIQIVEETKVIVCDIRLNPFCNLKKRACARKCSCPPTSSGIEVLAQLYSLQQVKFEIPSVSLVSDSPEARAEADASFLRSHWPFFSNTQNTKAAQSSKLSKLAEQAKDFAASMQLVAKDVVSFLEAERDSIF
ncbi:hypothetical protein CPB84DRAFT_1775905 [Gymnopilus junonius]|uniref:Wings apart-like protein C-terminal domain-containing protein n=1 Tax=Gymnopilus junonius TaxID=109634 RepID=A0A9P5NSH9_GYMJU|nr:hypothetical protein CPB84DRAFT_1775905 [Gymnopilus junonius]